ncbi:MAG: hypothetical protein COU65_01605 [Candidatus Pacebacteria bacterium CG10_big_fil_rev_8_21_14_0_10_42_12]|nr:type II toxin-antitoxin system RelE/ParE family toxin [Candidatus Paceibacterota bacterium]PIR62774.1 MAG: hypothetical protein COU65_01605 [Candidatus Pacebacteria bacterium CG10_big_fil_rev_8_21_14_0_10_42_12]
MSLFTVLFTRSAKKDIDKLDSITKKRLKKKLEIYSQDPLPYSKKLVNSKVGEYRWRIGNHRVVFDLDQDKKQIVVLRI